MERKFRIPFFYFVNFFIRHYSFSKSIFTFENYDGIQRIIEPRECKLPNIHDLMKTTVVNAFYPCALIYCQL